MFQIAIRNFQAIDSVEFAVDGFTALVGRSNIGKSAIVRAISAALSNEQGVKFVRHGPECWRRTKGAKTCHCTASVRIIGPGIDILWEKGDFVFHYVVNGTRYATVGKGLPDFLKDWFAPIKVGDTQTLLQVSDQFNPIFLLGEPGSVVADVLSDVARLENINMAIRLVEKDRRDVASTAKVREKDAKGLRDRIMAYSGLDETLDEVSSAENCLSLLEAKERNVEAMTVLLEKLSVLVRDIRDLAAAEQLNVPKIQVVTDGKTTFFELERKALNFECLTYDLVGLDIILAFDIPNVSLMDSSLKKMVLIGEISIRFEKCVSEIRKLRQADSLIIPPGISDAKVKLAIICASWLTRAKTLLGVLNKLVAVEATAVPDASRLDLDLERNSLASRYEGLVSDISGLEVELGTLGVSETEIGSELEKIGQCPLCGGVFDGRNVCFSHGCAPSGQIPNFVESGLS